MKKIHLKSSFENLQFRGPFSLDTSVNNLMLINLQEGHFRF